MGFTERVAQKQAASLPPSKRVYLEHLGEWVVVRTLMAGAQVRAQALGPDLQSLAIVAFSVEDPETPGVAAWQWHNAEHRDQIEKLDKGDFLAIINAQTELSGWGESEADLLGKSGAKANGSISSPPVTESPPVSLESGSTPGSSEPASP